jgi:hypothetical protein
LPAPNGAFHGAIAVNSIQLWEPLDDSIGEVARTLRPGGRLVALTHAGPSCAALAVMSTTGSAGRATSVPGTTCLAPVPGEPRPSTVGPWCSLLPRRRESDSRLARSGRWLASWPRVAILRGTVTWPWLTATRR